MTNAVTGRLGTMIANGDFDRVQAHLSKPTRTEQMVCNAKLNPKDAPATAGTRAGVTSPRREMLHALVN